MRTGTQVTPGYVDNTEIAAIGISLRRWVSIHGLALNVNTSARLFSFINPCGFTDRQAVSMAQILAYPIDMNLVVKKFLAHFSAVFEAELVDRHPGDTGGKQTPVMV